MSAEEIANKLWRLCDVLRDDGVTYHQYLNELTYILFLRLSEIKKFENEIPERFRWSNLKGLNDNKHLFETYRELLTKISSESTNETIKEIFSNASTTLRKPVNLRSLINSIDEIDWFDDEEKDKIASIYEQLLERNAGEKKSGAGQYFTPRPLINIIVELLVPKIGERWNDPAAGTFGFMIAADQYLRNRTLNYFAISEEQRRFQKFEAFSGCELVQDAHRLALMNAKLHNIEGPIIQGDTLSETGKHFKNYDGVLANPPFGAKKGGEKVSRSDLSFVSNNKQLNFLQHIYRSLKTDGKSRAGVIIPDNVLFDDSDGLKVRRDLMDKCNLHTILRLPTGIFYAAGIKTNVLFFTRGKKDSGNTKNIWVYDMRTNVPSYGKRNPFLRNAFEDFVIAYTGGISEKAVKADFDGIVDEEKRQKIANNNPRWRMFTRTEIAQNGDNLDIGILNDKGSNTVGMIEEPLIIAERALKEVELITAEIQAMIAELQ